MVSLLAATSTPLIVFLSLGGLFLSVWGWGKYKESQAEKRSEDLRNLYASVQTERRR